MDADTRKRMETGEMLNRQRNPKPKRVGAACCGPKKVFGDSVRHAKNRRSSLLVAGKAKPAAIEACTFLKWLSTTITFLSHACDYIPCLFGAGLKNGQKSQSVSLIQHAVI
jgi:hypothetical protein